MRLFYELKRLSLIFTLTFVLAVGAAFAANDKPLLLSGPEPPAKACLNYYASLKQTISLVDESTGPKVILPSLGGGTRKISDITQLKIGSYNVLNLQQHKGSFKRSESSGWRMQQVAPIVSKPERELRGIAETILRADPDILVLQEVDSVAALRVLAEQYLGDKYRLLLIKGNDERGIEIGFLVKKDLPFDLSLQSHRNLKFTNERSGVEEAIFSRDLPMLELRAAGADPNSAPIMTVLGTHFKSQRDAQNDKFSKYKRTKQAETAAAIAKKQQEKYPESTVVLTGDFNNDIRRTPEFNSLRENGMREVFDLSPHPIPKEQRTTHTYHPNARFTNYSQLDGMFILGRGQQPGIVTNARIMRYLDEHGNEKPIPNSIKERKRNPSDHFMIVSEWDFQKILSVTK